MSEWRNGVEMVNGYCIDYPACGHTDGLGCDYVPDRAYIWEHALCEHEIGYCDVAAREAEEAEDEIADPATCEHRNAYTPRMGGTYCDDCLSDIVMVTYPAMCVYVSAVVPGLMMSIPVLGVKYEAA